MGFFAPWFLAGIVAAGIPLWVHLLRQHKSIPRPFASLMFFEPRTQSSIKHRRLKHYLLLALRLAMILLLVLLFANPFIRRTVPFGSGRKLVFVAVDKSFSMRYGEPPRPRQGRSSFHAVEARRRRRRASGRGERPGGTSYAAHRGSRCSRSRRPRHHSERCREFLCRVRTLHSDASEIGRTSR